MTYNQIYSDCHEAIRSASTIGLRCVGYQQNVGWIIYDPVNGCLTDVEPEFFCIGLGRLPIPLNDETALTILMQMIQRSGLFL